METQELWPKETSTCNCLVRKARNSWREPHEVWTNRIRVHYKEKNECCRIALANHILKEYKGPYRIDEVIASMWRIDEEDLSPIWGMRSKGVNNV